MYLNLDKIIGGIAEGNWLTLTWDVFKLYIQPFNSFTFYGLTLTWDVFKLRDLIGVNLVKGMININMRCI